MTATRRHFLAASAAGPLLGPMVGRLRAEAAGAAPPKRVVFVVEGNGLPPDQILPVGVKRKGIPGGSAAGLRTEFRDIPLKDHDLPPALAPLAFAKDKVTVLQGLSGKMSGGGHSNAYGALGAYDAKSRGVSPGTPMGETVDVALGRALGGPFPHVGLGMVGSPDDGVVFNISAAGKDRPAPTQCNPALAYQALFGFAAGGSARRAFDTRKSLLDHLVDDAKRAEAALAGPERAKLQAYLQSFESMRERHGKLVEMEAAVRKHLPPVTDKFTSKVETDRLDAQFDLAAAALIAGLTNTVTLSSGAGTAYFGVAFSGLGINFGKHGIGHGGSYMGMTWDVMSVKIRKFHFELIARLVKKLQAAPEGNGTMFDNTVIVYLSDAAEGHHSRCWEWPMVLVGNLGGTFKAGRYVEFPGHGAKGHRHIGNLYTTFLNAVGDKRETFGHPDMLLGKDVDQRGGLPELLA